MAAWKIWKVWLILVSKGKNMERKIGIIDLCRITLLAAMWFAGGVQADIANTTHNLGSTGIGPNTFSGTSAVCVFCHTPHGSDTTAVVPLWNRRLAAPAAYTTFDTLGTSSLEGATAPVGSVSIACLSCHDGTQAMDMVLNAPGSGVTVGSYSAGVWRGSATPQGISLIMQDLSDDHPVGIQYGGGGISVNAPAAPTNDPDFTAPTNAIINSNMIWWVDTETIPNRTREKTDMQLYTRSVAAIDVGTNQPFVECASCHDPHSENTSFLRVSNTGSAVCLACHTK